MRRESAVSNVASLGESWSLVLWYVLQFFFSWLSGGGVQDSVTWPVAPGSFCRRWKEVQIYNFERKDPPAGRLLVGKGLGLK